MDQEKLNKLNDDIASLHSKDDVISYEIDALRRIKFPWGFLRPLSFYRSFFPFLNKTLSDKIAQHMMHRDTLHWIWLKTDISGTARIMLVKFQLI